MVSGQGLDLFFAQALNDLVIQVADLCSTQALNLFFGHAIELLRAQSIEFGGAQTQQVFAINGTHLLGTHDSQLLNGQCFDLLVSQILDLVCSQCRHKVGGEGWQRCQADGLNLGCVPSAHAFGREFGDLLAAQGSDLFHIQATNLICRHGTQLVFCVQGRQDRAFERLDLSLSDERSQLVATQTGSLFTA